MAGSSSIIKIDGKREHARFDRRDRRRARAVWTSRLACSLPARSEFGSTLLFPNAIQPSHFPFVRIHSAMSSNISSRTSVSFRPERLGT